MFDRYVKSRDKATIVLNWAIMAAAAHEQRSDQLAALEEMALSVALSGARRASARAFVPIGHRHLQRCS